MAKTDILELERESNKELNKLYKPFMSFSFPFLDVQVACLVYLNLCLVNHVGMCIVAMAEANLSS